MKKFAARFILAAATLLGIASPSFCRGAATVIPASDPRIQYTGRVDFSDPLAPQFDWSGVSILVHIKGPGLSFRLQGAKNAFAVQVDGITSTNWITNPNQTHYEVQGLADGEHTIKIVKRTEALYGPSIFTGLALDDATVLLAPPPRPRRKIEVVGDSWVCGYGNEGKAIHGPDLLPFENADQTFGMMVARDLQAEVHLVAYSGRGVVRNYGDAAPRSAEPFPKMFDRTLCARPEKHWDFSQWVPDAVIIHLGDNDYSTRPHPGTGDFVSGYVAFLQSVRAAYPHAAIFCFSVDGWPGFGPAVASAVKQRNAAGDQKVYQVSYPVIPAEELGCDSHPKVVAHRKLADILTPVLKAKLGW